MKNTLKLSRSFHPNKSSRNSYFKFYIADEICYRRPMSMLSDACETYKPVRIYYNDSFVQRISVL